MMAVLTTYNRLAVLLDDKGIHMNSNQRSDTNNQSSNGGDKLAEPSSRAFSSAKPAVAGGDAMQQGGSPGSAQSTESAGLPMAPAGSHLAADQKMDDDTGLSNTANREVSEAEQNERQERQSNVGRRSDGTPD